MRDNATAILYMALSVVAISWIFSSSAADQAPAEVGRYQASTSFKQGGAESNLRDGHRHDGTNRASRAPGFG
jgi:hypothetical protein